MNGYDRDLIIGALDTLALALSGHGHKWTVGEREIYEQAIKVLKTKDQHVPPPTWDDIASWMGLLDPLFPPKPEDGEGWKQL